MGFMPSRFAFFAAKAHPVSFRHIAYKGHIHDPRGIHARMFRVLGCVFEQHDLRLVAVAAGLCLLASATALTMIGRARAAGRGRLRLQWLTGAGAVAGCGIWATHFVAMLAYRSGLPIGFDSGLTIASAVIAMALCALGFAVAVGVNGAAGGLLTGGAIAAMHYTGMMALRLPAHAVWDTSYVTASVLIGVSLSGLALHFAVRRRGAHDYGIAAGLFVLAIVGLHFTGMTAVHYVPDGSILVGHLAMDPFALAVAVAASAAFIVAQGLVVAMLDRHLAQRAQGEAARMRAHIAELESAHTAQQKTSSDLTLALEAASEASRAKSAFLASMSHELRTPLNAVIGFSDTMQAELFGPLSARYRSYAADIHQSGRHLLALINDVLDLSKLEAQRAVLQEENFDIAELTGEVMRMILPEAGRSGLTLLAEVAPDLPLLNADRRRIKQILINLAANAIKFTPPGGQVRLAAHRTATALSLSVSDTGIGIAQEDIPRAMERFGQVDSSLARKYEGTGLGLPLSRQLAELHGGQLILGSAPGVGTTVTVTLPRERLVPRGAQTAAA
jgi:signal transduction histidine kinase